MCKRYMSDSKEGEQDEALTREDNELTARCSRNLHHEDDDDDGIDSQQQQQKPWALLGQRKGNKKNKEKDKKENSNISKRKMQEKTKIFLFSRLGKLDKQDDGTKNKAATITTLQSTAPFPYNGIDFGGSPPCNPCFLRSSIPLPSSPIHKVIPAAAKAPSPANSAKPKISSHYDFVKSLIEMNDFYSHGCNAHYEISNPQAK